MIGRTATDATEPPSDSGGRYRSEIRLERTDKGMYYLRKDDRAVYKHHDFTRFYRGDFSGVDGKYQGMKLYTCKTIKRILELRKTTFAYCGEWFDVYDENGKISSVREDGTTHEQ